VLFTIQAKGQLEEAI